MVGSLSFRIVSLLVVLYVSLLSVEAATITSNAVTGNWSTKGSWVGNVVPTATDDVVIVSGANITMQGNTTMNSLTINSGGILTDNGSGTITITGNLTVNGTFAGSSNHALTGSSKTIDGTGVISNTSTLTITNDKTVASTASLVKGSGTVTLSASTNVTNNGSITFGGALSGTNSTSQWTNASNSTLNAGDALLGTGSLDATASGNTVNYYSSTAQTIKRTNLTSFTYHHLVISGDASATKTFASFSYVINGNLTISSALAGSSSSATTITLNGNWVNTGTFTANSSSLTLSGSSSQTISSSSGETFYDLTVNNSSGVVADHSFSVTNSLTMTSGNIDISNNTLTLGSSTSNVGTLTHSSSLTSPQPTVIGKFERWIGSTSSPTAPVLFPVGTSSSYRPLQLTLSSITTAGSLIAEFVASSPGTFPGQHLDDGGGKKVYNPFVDGYWTLTTSNSFASSSYSLSLTLNNPTAFTNGGYNGIDDNTRLVTRASSSSSWALEGTHVTYSSGNTVSRSGLSTLSGQYCLGDDTNCQAPTTSSITATSGTEICNGATGQVYSVSNTGGSTYAWTLSSGGTITSSPQTTNSITVTWSSSGGARTVSVVENNGCALGSTVSLGVNVHPVAPGAISGKANAPTNSSGVLANETYSVTASSGYTYTWDIVPSSGGTVNNGASPNNSITVQWGAAGTDVLRVYGTKSGCSGNSAYTTLSVNVYSVIYSNKTTGNWNTNNTWTCSCTPGSSDNIVILNGHTVTVNSSGASAKHLTINAGGTLNTSSNAITINGDFTINGSLIGTGTATLSSSVTSPVLDGVGTFTAPITFSSNRSVNSSALLTQTSATNAFTVASGVTVNNYGSITLAGALTAGSTTSTWVNQTDSKLSVGGALFSSPAGVLTASATGNTVTYAGSVATANIKSPSSSYYHLTIANTGGSRTAPSGTLKLNGDFTNNSTSAVTLPFDANGGTIQFDGTSTISGTATTTFNNITISSGASVTAPSAMNVQGNISVSGTFTHNSGTITLTGTSAQTISGSNASTTAFNSITINSGAILSAPSTLNLQGNLTNNNGGVTGFVHNNGTVAFSPASTTSQILGNSKFVFYNLSVTNGSASTDLILENTKGADLTNILNINSATFDADGASVLTPRVFTLLSSSDRPSTSDASIAAISSGGAVTGNVTVQRYMSRIGDVSYDYQVWHDISSPVVANADSLQNKIPVTGPFSGSSVVADYVDGNGVHHATDYTVSSIQTYTESKVTNHSKEDGWTDFPDITAGESLSTNFTAGKGYSVFIFGPDSETNGANLWALRGPINSGDISLPVSYHDHLSGDTNDNGWNLVGNPYPSTIDWNSSAWTKTNIGTAIYIDDFNTANPVFAAYVYDPNTGIGAGTNGGSRYIAMGQGFWVKADANPILTATESVKTAGQSTKFFRSAVVPDMLRVALTSSDQLRDETVVYFSNSTTTEFDQQSDALKLPNQYGYLNLSSQSPSGKKYAINGAPFSNCGQTVVSLNVSDVADGNYTLSFSDYGAMSSAMQIMLKDNFTNTTTDVRANQTYSFTVDLNDAASYGSNRFKVIFAYTATTATPISLKGIDTCEPTQGKVIVKNSSLDFNYSLVSPLDGTVLVPSVQGTGADIEFMIPNSLASGANSFVVKELNRFCNTLAASASTSVALVLPPAKPTAQTAQTCGSGSVTLTATGAPSDGHYLWYDAIDSNTAYTTQASVFVTEPLTKSRTYFVASVNRLGCEGERVEVAANVVTINPATITVTELNTLQSNYQTGNQWYLNGNSIFGATSPTLKIDQSGTYKLVVTAQGCTVSDEKEMIVTEVTQVGEALRLYPNPVNGVLTVEVDGSGALTGEIYNSLGVVVSTLSFSSIAERQVAVHNFAGHASGMYFIKVSQHGKPSVLRVVKE